MKTYVTATMVLFGAIAALQVARLILGWPVTIAGVAVPLWASGVVAAVAAVFAGWALRLIIRSRATG